MTEGWTTLLAEEGKIAPPALPYGTQRGDL